jgi:hypothetical protein
VANGATRNDPELGDGMEKPTERSERAIFRPQRPTECAQQVLGS